jgi:cephalosporin hydroxylase
MGSEVITDEQGMQFRVHGTLFRQLTPDSSSRKTTNEEVLILKSPNFLRKYDDVFRTLPVPNVMEFGIAEGGSILYFAQAFPDYKYVGIDIRDPNEALLEHIRRLGLEKRVKLYYNVDQSDEQAVNNIINSNFGSERIGCIIDDASHMYNLSRLTFEHTFSRVAAGGYYCLEDWSWAHEAGQYQNTQWIDQPALTNLVFEMIMLLPSTRGLIDNIFIDFNVTFIKRGGQAPEHVDLTSMILNRGRQLSLI